MTELERALNIAERITKYTLCKSMNELRKMIKSELKSRGLQDQMKNFKIKKSGEHDVTVYIKDGCK